MTDEHNKAIEGNSALENMENYAQRQLDDAAALQGLLNGISSNEPVVLTPKQVTDMLVLIGNLVVYTTSVSAITQREQAREMLKQ